jgi:hypothetical protein
MQDYPLREHLKNALRRAGLLPAAFRIHETARGVRRPSWWRAGVTDDGLPLPPALLRTRVVGTGDPAVFFRQRATHSNLIAGGLASVNAPTERAQMIFDFGCGCDRVLRHWRGLPGEIVVRFQGGREGELTQEVWMFRKPPAEDRSPPRSRS